MKKLVLTVGVVALCAVGLADAKATFRDAQGRNMGSASTDRYGRTTYRDAQGRLQGTSSTDRYGKTTYRDAQGRLRGSKK